MPTDIAPLNPPNANASSAQTFWKHNSKRFNFAADKRGIIFVPYSSVHRPIVLNFSGVTGITVESTVCPNDVLTEWIADPVEAVATGRGAPTFITETLSGNRLVMNQAATALRITSKTDTALVMDMLV